MTQSGPAQPLVPVSAAPSCEATSKSTHPPGSAWEDPDYTAFKTLEMFTSQYMMLIRNMCLESGGIESWIKAGEDERSNIKQAIVEMEFYLAQNPSGVLSGRVEAYRTVLRFMEEETAVLRSVENGNHHCRGGA